MCKILKTQEYKVVGTWLYDSSKYAFASIIKNLIEIIFTKLKCISGTTGKHSWRKCSCQWRASTNFGFLNSARTIQHLWWFRKEQEDLSGGFESWRETLLCWICRNPSHQQVSPGRDRTICTAQSGPLSDLSSRMLPAQLQLRNKDDKHYGMCSAG